MALLSVAPFKVHFTSLSRYWSPCTLSHSSLFPRPFKCCSLYCAAGGPSLCVCEYLCIFNLLCFMSVCAYAWMYESMCCRGDRCAYFLKHDYMGVYTCILCSHLCLYPVCGAATGVPPFSNVFVSACVNIYKCLQ